MTKQVIYINLGILESCLINKSELPKKYKGLIKKFHTLMGTWK